MQLHVRLAISGYLIASYKILRDPDLAVSTEGEEERARHKYMHWDFGKQKEYKAYNLGPVTTRLPPTLYSQQVTVTIYGLDSIILV